MMLATRSKRFLAMLLALIMCLSTLPVGVFAQGGLTAEQQQNRNNQIVSSGGTILPEDGKGNVQMTKTAELTEEEGKFLMTLQVKTKDEIKQTTTEVAPTIDVVLVIDNSSSMNNGDRLDSAKQAATQFINSFLGDEPDGNRKVAVVTYGKTADTKSELSYDLEGLRGKPKEGEWKTEWVWVEGHWEDWYWIPGHYEEKQVWVPATENAYEGGAINNIKNLYNTGTNIQAGLKKARDILSGSSAEYKYVLLLSDGEPTYYYDGSGWQTNVDKSQFIAVDEYDGRGYYETTYQQDYIYTRFDYSDIKGTGSSTGKNHAYNTVSEALLLKNAGIEIYGVGISLQNSAAAKYTMYNSVTSDEGGYESHYINCEAGSGTELAEQLNKAFEIIETNITVKTNAWIVSDTMGQDVTFAGFVSGKQAGAKMDGTGKQLTWNLKSLAAYDKKEGEWYVYTCQYYVTLDNGARDGSAYDTNQVATLTYSFEDDLYEEDFTDQNGVQHYAGEQKLYTSEFTKPQVKGYRVDLTFDKEDPAENAINGVQFTLTCKDCGLTVGPATAVAGKVSFAANQGKGIPSGHTYTLRETEHDGYQPLEDTYEVSVVYGVAAVTKNGEPVNIDGMVITNKHNPENRDLTITKAWLPATIAPSTGSVTVDLYCGEDLVKQNIQISSSNNWTVTIAIPTVDEDTGLSLTDSYTVKETDHPSGSTPSSQAFKVNYDEESGTYTCTVTNVRSGQDDITVTKTWVGGENHPSVTLGLVAMGETTPAAGLTVELSENNLSHTFPSVELYDDNGDPYNYRVMEKVTVEENGAMVTKWVSTGAYDIGGVKYVVSTSGYTVTNTIAQETSVTVSGHKEWVDGNNTGAIRPDSVVVNLYADGKDTGLTATATGTTWTFDFGSSLPKYAIPETQVGSLTYGTTEGLTADGHEIEYTVKDSVDGYAMTSEGTADNGYTVTNTREDIADTDEVTITKKWEDDKNADDTRPDSVTLILQRSSNGTADDTFNSANHTYTFLQDTEVYEVTQTYTFENLPVYDEAGYEYRYTVKEEGEQGNLLAGKDGVKYAVRYEDTTAINSLNTGSATTSVTVHKNWVAPSTEGLSVTVYVMNGDQQAASKTLDGTETTPWTYEFTDLPMYGSDGKKINYTVKEDPVAGYTPSAPVLENGVWNITNTIEQDNTMEVSVQKTWDNGTATVPADLEVTLYADDIKVGSYNLTAEESWGYTFKNLPRYAIPGTTTINGTSVSLDLDGHAIRYTVEEEKAAGYTMTHSSRTESVNVSYQFTNSFDAGTTHIQVNKLWKDPGNSGTRPDSIWVGLFADGVYKDHMELTAANNWSGEFPYQPMYSDVNKTIAYTVREMADAGDTEGVVSGEKITLGDNTYTVTILSGTITNTMEGDVDGSQVVYSVNKVWNGPSSTAVSFGLYESNTAADPIQTISGQDMVALLNAENVWVGTFAAVPKYDDNGQRINYVVKEIFTLEEDTFAVTSGIVSLDGITYTASSQQSGNTMIFTNTVNETNDASISGVKQWVLDGAPADVNAPASIQVELYADDVATGEIKTVDAEDNWAYEWTGLQRYNSETHMPIEYSVREVGAYGVTTLDAEGAIQQTLVKYGDNYFTVTYENGNIINTYLTRDEYMYRVDRIYNYYVDGVLQSTDTVKGDLISGSKGQVVTDLNTDSYKNTDNKSEYNYISGGPTFTDGDTVKVGVTLTEPGEYVITLTYEYRYTTPTDPGTGGGGGGGWTPPTPDPEPDEELPDEETPLNPAPDDDVIDIGENETPMDDGTEIIDPETPLGDLPQTGAAEAVNPFATAGFMALAASMAAAGLVLTRTKSGKREED